MIRSHKIALDPNDKQATLLAKSAGCARFAWNWGLTQWQAQYQAGEKPNEMAVRKQLNAIKKEQFPWMYEVSKVAPQQAIVNLGKAFDNFFAKRAKYPKFKKKGLYDAFRADNGPGTFEVDNRRIRLPKIGWLRMREALRFDGKLLSATVSKKNKKWYVGVQVEVQDCVTVHENKGIVGVDLGITTLATLSTGEKIAGPRPMRAAQGRVRMLAKAVSRKQKCSENRKKAAQRLGKQHARLTNIRVDALHKLTTRLTKHFSTILIEDLNVSGMVKNRHLSKAISDMGFFEFRRQLAYKATLYGAEVIVVNRFFPSSKTCSECGEKIEQLPLSVREWSCPACGVRHDRDVNAARNIAKQAASLAVTACGVERAGTPKRCTKRSTRKQEPSFKSEDAVLV